VRVSAGLGCVLLLPGLASMLRIAASHRRWSGIPSQQHTRTGPPRSCRRRFPPSLRGWSRSASGCQSTSAFSQHWERRAPQQRASRWHWRRPRGETPLLCGCSVTAAPTRSAPLCSDDCSNHQSFATILQHYLDVELSQPQGPACVMETAGESLAVHTRAVVCAETVRHLLH
jgi:hypothetical protein